MTSRPRTSTAPAQSHVEFDRYIGADDIRRGPLTRSDAKGPALHDRCALHRRRIRGLDPAKENLDRLWHAFERQCPARDIVATLRTANVGRVKLGFRKALDVEPFG